MSPFLVWETAKQRSAMVLLLVAAILQTNCFALPLISDAKLIEIFHEHRGTFERLREMAVEHGLDGRIGFGYVDDKNLPTERVEEYRKLMRDSGVESLGSSTESGSTGFTVHDLENVFGGRSKGIVYSPEPPMDPTADSLDKPCRKPAGGSVCRVERHIEGNWWMWRQDSW